MRAWVCTFKYFQERREGISIVRFVFLGDWEPPPLTRIQYDLQEPKWLPTSHCRRKSGTSSLIQLHSGGLERPHAICLLPAETHSPHWDFMETRTKAVQEDHSILNRIEPQWEGDGQLLQIPHTVTIYLSKLSYLGADKPIAPRHKQQDSSSV